LTNRLFKRKKQDKGPKFSAGEIVQIRTREEISRGLDPLSKHEGCLMMEQMWDYCGKSFKVQKVVNTLLDEYLNKMFNTKTPLYLLEGLICDGIVESYEHQCDRSCYFMWHEDWIEGPKLKKDDR